MATRRRITMVCLWIGIAAAFLYDRPGFSGLAFGAAAVATAVAVGAAFLPIRTTDQEEAVAAQDVEAATLDADAEAADALDRVERRWEFETERRTLVYAFAIKRLKRPTFPELCVEIIERLGAGPEAGKQQFIFTPDGRFFIRPLGKPGLPARASEIHRLPEVEEEDEDETHILH